MLKAGLRAIVFGVDDVRKEFDRLTSSGVVFKSAPKSDQWGTSAIFDDSFGNLIQIHQG